MHRLVLRQLRRHFGETDSVPEEWKAFLQEVSEAYISADEDRLLVERSLDLTSQELTQRLEERKQAEEATRVHMERLKTLTSLAQKISAITNLDEILSFIASSAAELLDITLTRVFIIQDEMLELRAENGGLLPSDKKNIFPIDEGVLGQAISSGKLCYIEDIQSHSSWKTSQSGISGETRSYIGIPLKSGESVLGLLDCISQEVRTFTKDELELLETLANAGAIAIEKARLHQEAQQSLNFFRSIIEDNADAITILDCEHKIIQWNAGAEKLFGYSEKEAARKDIEFIVPGKRTKMREIVDRDVFQRGIPIHFEADRVKKDGTIVPVSITISPVKNENGEVIASCTIHKDLSEQKRADELEKSKEAAEAASEAKSAFLSTMSHELRSPLNAIIGFSDLLLMDTNQKDDQTLQLIPKIRDAGKYLLAMIEEILDLDRIEAGKVRLDTTSVAINDFVSDLVDSWHPNLPEGFTLTSQLDWNCGVINCDSTRIGQVLNNLIDNAIKYSPEGGTIHLSTSLFKEEVHISVQDEGMGISPDAQNNIFERFHQLESGYTRRAGGLGIGLALARELIEMHGGRIWVYSEEEKGSTFTIALPYAMGHLGGPITHADEGIPAIEAQNPWEGRIILVVDDVEHYHEYMKILMSAAKHLEFAHNGLEGIETAQKLNPDLIFMDIRMPVMDGCEAIRRLKSDPATKDIPIVAMTAQAMATDKQQALQAGADGFVTKPVDIDSLILEMERVLGVGA